MPTDVQGGGFRPAADFDGAGATESSRLSGLDVGFPVKVLIAWFSMCFLMALESFGVFQ